MTSKEYSKENKKAIIICGPTASGKSSLAMEVCQRLNGSVISADSRQIYKKLDIGTAKPSQEDMDRIPHYMIDVVEITEDFTAVDFSRLAREYIEQIFNAGRIPIIAGGAGLYLEALTGKIVEAPPRDDAVRGILERRISEEGSRKLHEELRLIDPESAADISPSDPVRIVRALEIFELSGESASLIKKTGRYPLPNVDFLWIGLDPGRETLYRRIDVRVERMIEAGLVEETQTLVRKGMGEVLRKKKIVGYAEVLETLDGHRTLDEAISLIKQHTRNYAKRQMTWFRNRLSPVWVNPAENGFRGKVFQLIDEYLKRA
jgi:tRNA dimethylallyltransferase